MAHISHDEGPRLVKGTVQDDEIYSSVISTSKITVQAGAGNDVIFEPYATYCFLYGEAGNDTIRAAPHSYVDGGIGNDTITGDADDYSYEGYFTLVGGAGNDTIDAILCLNASLDGGADDDVISASGADLVILGGAGNDWINCGLSQYEGMTMVATLEGGTGNDTISMNGGHSDAAGALFKYHSGDGNDVIYGANSKVDVLELDTNYTLSYTQDESQYKNNRADLIVTMANGSTVTFKSLDIGEYIEHPLQITGGSGGWGSSGYTYSGGSQTISDYTGEKVKWNADFTGLGFNNTDFLLYSSSGALTLKNVRDKVIDVADGNGNTVAYAFMASGGGTIDGSGFSPLEVILGGNNASNVIKAGSGGSSLWGGAGNTADTLSGGGGIDYFFVGKDDGSDVIQNASQNDRVMLYNTALSDIANAGTSSNSISLTFNTGATLVVNDKGGLSPSFQLAEGSCWKFNHSTNNWQSG